MKTVYIICVVFIMTGCITQKRCERLYPCRGAVDTIVKDSIVYIIKDSIYTLPTDSSTIKALIICEDEIPRLKQIIAYASGKRVEVPVIRFKHDTLFVDCKVDSAEITLTWAEKNQYRLMKVNETIVKRENYITGWQWAQIWMGRLLIIAIAIILILFLLRIIFKIGA